MIDIMISQSEKLGSVIKVDQNEESYGFISVINMQTHQDMEFVKQIKQYLLSKAQGEQKTQLQQLFENSNQSLGLIVNERMINIPPQLAPPLHKQLFDEINRSVKEDKGQNPTSKPPFEFDNYLVITSCFLEKGKKGNSKKGKGNAEDIYYVKPEDAVYAQEASLSFKFQVPNTSGDPSWKSMKAVLVVPHSKIETVLEKMNSFIGTA